MVFSAGILFFTSNMEIHKIWDYQIHITEKNDFDLKQKLYPKLSQKVFISKQEHGNSINLWKPGWDNNIVGDWIISNQKNIKLAVWVSDCNAVVVMWKERYSIVHAGRAGLKADIVSQAFDQLIQQGETEFMVFVGPSIRSCCYEVGEEFKNYFSPKYLEKKSNNHYQFDMILMIQDLLKKYNCRETLIHSSCTKCSDRFFSYRNWDKINNLITIEKF